MDAHGVDSTSVVRTEQTLVADRRAPATARASVRATCANTLPHLVEDAELLVSEVVTNAVKHGRAPVRLQIACEHSAVFVAVDDANPALPKTRRLDRRRHSGRGLVLLDRLATEWGVRRVAGGKQVWFRLA